MIRIIFNTVVSILKTLMIMGVIEFIAPGMSYEVSKELAKMMFKG